jgi:hypothetical protein
MSTLSTTNLKNPTSGSNNIVLGTDGSSTLGTAKITTLADSAGANTSTPAAIASGIAKAWVNFNGTGTVAIRASYNVSSITDNGVGDYTVNFTTAMVDANYSVSSISASIPNSGGVYGVAQNTATAPTSSAFRLNVQSAGGTQNDNSYVNLQFFR